jgi:hypothetical protein
MKNDGETIFLITYFSGIDGNSPAEWADDKIKGLKIINKKVILLTSIMSKHNDDSYLKVYKVPSISLKDYLFEINEFKLSKRKIPYFFYIYTILPFTLGVLYDLFQYIIIKGGGEGRWSWAVNAFFVSLYICILNRIKFIYTTGGPAASHLIGVSLSFFKINIISELQDPLYGKDIGRYNSVKFLRILEIILVKFCWKLVYVTKKSFEESFDRFHKENLTYIYPSSRKYHSFKNNFSKDKLVNKIEILHLGTLYTNRNFINLIKAIEQLIREGKIPSNFFKITNFGEIYGNIKTHHLSKNFITQISIKNRLIALKKAMNYDYMLLVQHTDKRSNLTIPYKFYDYLNINKPMFGILNNQELEKIFKKNNYHHSNASNIFSIRNSLIKIYNEKKLNNILISRKLFKLDFQNQLTKLFKDA